MLECFVLGEKSEISYEEVEDKKAPEGMKLASNKGIEYKFYVPKAWITDPEDDLTYAYYPESERSNVTVTSFVPDSSMSVNDYFEKCELEYKELFGESYTRVSGPDARKVSGKSAHSYTYTFKAEGVDMKIMQTIFVVDSSFYAITYTARADKFDSHLDDVESMVDSFKLR